MAVEGTDRTGHVIWRFDQSVMSAVVIRLDIKIVGNGSFSLLPGESVNVSAQVTSVGVAATWHIRVSDTLGFYTGNNPIVYVTRRGVHAQSHLGSGPASAKPQTGLRPCWILFTS